MKAFSPFKEHRILVNERVRMRDGVRLATTVFLPMEGDSFPTVLVRIPYNRANVCGWAGQFTGRGMAFVAQDTRGRYGSDGHFYPFVHEREDGLDTLDWLHSQAWCDDTVGMLGDSYLGAVQFAVADSGHPLLTALNPRFMAGDSWQRGYYCDGVYSLGLTFSWLVLEVNSPVSDAHLTPMFDIEGLVRQLPLGTLDEKMGCEPAMAFRNTLKHPAPDQNWDDWRWRERFPRSTVPMLMTGGWYDYYAGDCFRNFAAMRSGADANFAAAHRVIVGPWTHGVNGGSQLGQFDFGPEALAENDHHVRWLETLLKGKGSVDFQEAPIRIFVMGDNVWRAEWEWPLARTEYTPFYFAAEAPANGRDGQGTLTASPPTLQIADRYEYDPENPVPTTGGNHSVGQYNPGLYEICMPGPQEQTPVESREDVLIYTSEPLADDLEVTGPVTVTMFAASSAPDTDWVARLCDVYPDGRSFNITEGAIRASFHALDWLNPEPIVPERVYEYTVDLQVTSNVFKAGHRLRVQVTSSNFPLWARNLNCGEPYETGVNMQIARQTIYHDEEHPSHILLPVIPRPGSNPLNA